VLILGIDPGSRHTGYGLVQQSAHRLEAVQFGRVTCDRKSSLTRRLGVLATDLEELLQTTRPDAVAIESTFLGMNPKSLVVLSQARGAVLSVLGRHEIDVFEYSPAEVKSAVADSGQADKEQVARMVRLLLELPDGPIPNDATDALAVAICCAHRRRFERLGKASAC